MSSTTATDGERSGTVCPDGQIPTLSSEGVPSGRAPPIWQKSATATSDVDAQLMALMAGEDVRLDREFLLCDLRASKAHVQGLARSAVLSPQEAEAIAAELDQLAADFRSKTFVLDERFEDGHSAIEARLIERLGATGKKVHTGRSRNDQVLVATRLWLKEQLAALEDCCVRIARVCGQRAGEGGGEFGIPMPGYTHLQRAVVSSTAMWFAGWAEAFTEDACRARQTQQWIDRCPLGTAAGYGVNVPLDREFTAAQLGFARLQCSPIAAQLSRGKFEMAALEAFGACLLDVRRLAWDLSLFTSAEFNFVRLPSEYTTGSSIMPNKRNPDVIELLRAGYARVSAARTEVEQVLSLPSGYHRDLQITKGALVRGCQHGLQLLSVVPDLVAKLQWNERQMRAAIEPAMYATDAAIELSLAGVPFRDAYRRAAEELKQMAEASALSPVRTPERSLAERVSLSAAPTLQRVNEELDLLCGDRR